MEPPRGGCPVLDVEISEMSGLESIERFAASE
jgi:hypothetical protein